MPHARRLFGNAAELLAEQFLQQQGYRIRARQFLTRLGEIDLVAVDGDEVVFVEVKARRSLAYGRPEAAVTPTKLRKLSLAAALYLRQHQLEGAKYRIDVVALVCLPGKPPDITHLVGVW